jgi:hypothetical protein
MPTLTDPFAPSLTDHDVVNEGDRIDHRSSAAWMRAWLETEPEIAYTRAPKPTTREAEYACAVVLREGVEIACIEREGAHLGHIHLRALESLPEGASLTGGTRTWSSWHDGLERDETFRAPGGTYRVRVWGETREVAA